MYIYRDNRIMYSNINIAMPFDICYGDGHKTMPTAVQRSSCNGKWNEKKRERERERKRGTARAGKENEAGHGQGQGAGG